MALMLRVVCLFPLLSTYLLFRSRARRVIPTLDHLLNFPDEERRWRTAGVNVLALALDTGRMSTDVTEAGFIVSPRPRAAL